MRKIAYPPVRAEPTLSDAAAIEIDAESAERVRAAAVYRPSRLRRIIRSLVWMMLITMLIIGLSYLPESWSQQQHPHIQDALQICRDIRGLVYRVGLDLWQWLQAEAPQWYRQVQERLATAL